jgi:hypothetical protein
MVMGVPVLTSFLKEATRQAEDAEARVMAVESARMVTSNQFCESVSAVIYEQNLIR